MDEPNPLDYCPICGGRWECHPDAACYAEGEQMALLEGEVKNVLLDVTRELTVIGRLAQELNHAAVTMTSSTNPTADRIRRAQLDAQASVDYLLGYLSTPFTPE